MVTGAISMGVFIYLCFDIYSRSCKSKHNNKDNIVDNGRRTFVTLARVAGSATLGERWKTSTQMLYVGAACVVFPAFCQLYSATLALVALLRAKDERQVHVAG